MGRVLEEQRGAAGESATRSRIVEAATGMFLARGFDAVTTSQLAEAAGITAPALYWHFKSKMDLFAEVLETSYRSFFVTLLQQTTGDDARQRLHSYVRALVELQLRDQDLMFGLGQLKERLPADRKGELARLQRAYGEHAKEILQQGVDEGYFDLDDLSLTSLAIHTMCEYAVVWYRPHHRLSAAQVAEQHARMALRMAGSVP